MAGIDSPDADVADYLRELLESVRTVPRSGLMRGRLGMAYDVNGFGEAALATYAQAESLDPRDFRWPYFRAQLIAERGRYEAALATLDRALGIDVDYAPAWLWRGSWLIEAGHIAEAKVAFDRAFDLDPNPVAALGRARVLIAEGQHPAAIEILEPLARASEHPYIFRTLGEALRAVGRTDAARIAMVRGRDARPVSWTDERRDQRNVHIRGHESYNFAKQLSAAGRVDEALAILERLQAHHPEEHCARPEEFFLACNLMNSASIAYDRAGNPERALATVRRGLARNATFVPFHLTIANLFRQQGDLDGALTHVDRAIDLSPARGYAHEQRGRLLFGLERYAQAKVAFEAALEFEPGKRTTLFYLGLTAIELDDWAEAVERFEGVIRIEPDFALGHVFLARGLGETGRIEAAREAQRNAREYGADATELRSNEMRLRELEARQQQELAQ